MEEIRQDGFDNFIKYEIYDGNFKRKSPQLCGHVNVLGLIFWKRFLKKSLSRAKIVP